MHPLFPALSLDKTHRLKVDDVHELYIEECGNRKGIPILFVHGGPGAGCEPYHRRFFDPNIYHIILFDQRGAGQSTPHASLENNTTQDLVADMEKIRDFLGIDRWVLFGGSWGSTLSLVYAETHPQNVLGLILRGIFLCQPKEIQWFYQNGANRIFPDYWKDFIQPIPENERDNLVAAHYKRLVGDNELARMASAKAWSLWEARTATLTPKRKVVDFFGTPRVALALARIEAHYFMHDSFLADNQILCNTKKIKGIPGYIIHGRYDMICPLENAFALADVWPAAQLEIIPAAGHSASEPAIVDALIQATNGMVSRLED
ncbi:MAG: prolyl aminopeptidase [Acidiferrobacterales bacterium]